MRKLYLKTAGYNHLEQGFKEWLDILGYCQMSIYNLPNIIREFLHFLETKEGIVTITELEQKHIRNYRNYISSRGNQRRGGALSNNYINKHVQAIEKFLEYLRHKGMNNVPTTGIRLLKLNTKAITVLTEQEVEQLYNATDKESSTLREQAMESRDRAMLTIYYSCGLRRNEGVHVELNDINFDTRLLHVKKGKNYKERFVPLSKRSSEILQEYVYDYRPLLIKSKTQSRLFISYSGKPMNGGGLYRRFKLLLLGVENPELNTKNIGLHALRHSIATHLLSAGMELQKIQKFLGHSSLESTQIYTHLIEKEDVEL